MEATETIKPFSSIGKPGKFDREKAILYRDGLNRQIFNTIDSYRELQLKQERDKMNEQIAYYMENHLSYNL